MSLSFYSAYLSFLGRTMTVKSDAHPELLYHGSRYQQTELMPGFKRSGKLVKWDQTESNLFLYATSVRETAIELGFASSIEKSFDISRFYVEDKVIHIETDEKLSERDLEAVEVYLYTIECRDQDEWVKNRNHHNGLTTEFKTDHTIHSIVSCEEIDVRAWLSQYTVQIKKTVHGGHGRGKEVTMESQHPSWLKW